MYRTKYQGYFQPKNPDKYVGNKEQIIFRSLWELNVMKYLDEHSDVIQWSSEELIIPYISPIDGKPHRYFPDFIVKLRNRSGIIETIVMEVKPFHQTQPPDISKKRSKRLMEEMKVFAINQAKFEAAKSYCDKIGWRFEIVTENDLKLN